jgi:branched-chain amino acid transport system permease protein
MAGRLKPITLKPITVAAGVFFLVAAIAPLFVPSWATLFALILAKSIVVLGIILLLQAGQVSFGHAMFFATGAYTAAFWGKFIGGGDILLDLLLGAVSSTLLGLIVGLFVVRYREIFFGMLNLAFSMVLWSLLEKMFHYTNGADGIRVARPGLLGLAFTPDAFQYVVLYVSLLIAVAAFFGVQRYLDSPLGHMLRAIKSNETRLEYLGTSARRVLLVGYVISALLGGIGGTLVAIIQQIATPEFGYWTKSGEFVFIAILGGGAHAFGAFAGAAMFEVVRFYAAAQLANAWQLILGVVFIVIILYAPNGLIGLRQRDDRAKQRGH